LDATSVLLALGSWGSSQGSWVRIIASSGLGEPTTWVYDGLEPKLHSTECCDSRNVPTLSSHDILLVVCTTWHGTK